jgi:syntaxin 16
VRLELTFASRQHAIAIHNTTRILLDREEGASIIAAVRSFNRAYALSSPRCGAIERICTSPASTYTIPGTDSNCSYISYRQSYAHHPAKKPKYSSSTGNGYSDSFASGSSERQGLMSAGAFEDDGDAVIEMDLLPPRWADVSDEVTELLTDIAGKSVKLEKLHQKHVLPGFDDEEVKKTEEGEIEKLTQDITRGFHECQKAIQKVEQMVRESKQQGGISKGEETMARNIQISLAGRVQEASAGFRKKQSAYLKSMFL